MAAFRKRKDEAPPDPQGDAAAAEQDSGGVERGAGSESAASDATELARQRDEYLEAWQRARADYQNLRRRSQADVELATRRAKEGLLHELLLVLDHLDMALATPCQSQDAKNLAIGVRLTRDQMMQVLEREGVRPVPEGGTFDPAVHQAVSTVVSEEHEPGAVVATVRKGYLLGDHPLRHAQVQVATAPADEAAEEGRWSSAGGSAEE